MKKNKKIMNHKSNKKFWQRQKISIQNNKLDSNNKIFRIQKIKIKLSMNLIQFLIIMNNKNKKLRWKKTQIKKRTLKFKLRWKNNKYKRHLLK